MRKACRAALPRDSGEAPGNRRKISIGSAVCGRASGDERRRDAGLRWGDRHALCTTTPVAHFLTPVLESTSRCGLRIERTGTWLAEWVEGAFDSQARKRGLLGRDRLPAERALVIAPCQAVHTFAMRFALDIVAVSRDGRVLKIWTGVPPRRIAIAWSAFAIVELAAGVCAGKGLVVGDRLVAIAAECESQRPVVAPLTA